MAFSPVDKTKFFQLTLSFEYYKQGWQEKQFLVADSYATAQAAGLLLCAHRLKCLPVFCRLTYAKVNLAFQDRDAQMVDLGYPVDGLFVGADSVSADSVHPGKHLNSIEDVVAYRIENEVGAWVNRWMHGVPDQEVFADDLVNSIASGASSPDADSAISATGTWRAAVTNYFKAIKTYCKMSKTVHQQSGDVVNSDIITKVYSRGLSNRRCGVPFGTKAGRAQVG